MNRFAPTLFAATIVACSSAAAPTSTTTPSACVPGEQNECSCANGSPGAQSCDADGSYAACECAAIVSDAGKDATSCARLSGTANLGSRVCRESDGCGGHNERSCLNGSGCNNDGTCICPRDLTREASSCKNVARPIFLSCPVGSSQLLTMNGCVATTNPNEVSWCCPAAP